MVKIEKVTYSNEHGELVTVDFTNTDIEYCVDRVTDLLREMAAGGRELGPPPLPGRAIRSARVCIGAGV